MLGASPPWRTRCSARRSGWRHRSAGRRCCASRSPSGMRRKLQGSGFSREVLAAADPVAGAPRTTHDRAGRRRGQTPAAQGEPGALAWLRADIEHARIGAGPGARRPAALPRARSLGRAPSPRPAAPAPSAAAPRRVRQPADGRHRAAVAPGRAPRILDRDQPRPSRVARPALARPGGRAADQARLSSATPPNRRWTSASSSAS